MTNAATDDEAPYGRTPTGRARKRPVGEDTVSTAHRTDARPVSNGATDFLTIKRQEINARMEELKPLVEEHNRLVEAHEVLEAVSR